MELIIRNGYVIDPLNDVKGEVMDICIREGKIVEKVSPEAEVIDASGKLVLPGGIDIHSHIAGSKVNTGRIMMTGDHYRSYMSFIPGVRRSGTGKYTPSTYLTGYRYARMGWTFVMEPASPPLKTRHTHEELNDIPMIDKSCLILMDSNRIMLEYIAEKDYEGLRDFVSWLLHATKGYGVKLVDPGVAVPWSLGKGYGLDIDDTIEPYGLTPRDVVTSLCKVNLDLKLPHAIHVHCNRLGIPGNYETTLKTMDSVSQLSDGNLVIHATHIQFHSYKGADWFELHSGAEDIAKYVNAHRHVSLDLGQIDFGTAITMTADAPFEFALYHLSPWKWAGTEVELESAAGIVPFKYRKKSLVNALQWCIGLETALLVEDPWRTLITTDHPNGAPMTRYPKIMALLMSSRFRRKIMEGLNRTALKRACLPAIDRELTLYDIAVMTRASPAKLLRIEGAKGHIGPGADADISIYDIDPMKIDPSREYEAVIRAFKRASYTLKGGEIIVRNGEIARTMFGETYWCDIAPSEDFKRRIPELQRKFEEYYTIGFPSYVVEDRELRRSRPVKPAS